MPVVIRPAEPRDREILVEQFLRLNEYERRIASNRRTDRPGAEMDLDAALDRIEATDGVALVAEVRGRVVGHLFLTFEHAASYVREEMRPYACVTQLFVSEDVRGGGVGTMLMNEAEGLAARRGLRRIMVGVLAGNPPAERLYSMLGYEPHAIELEKAIAPL